MRYGKAEATAIELPIIFTGDAIAQLALDRPVDLAEWEYHEQCIDGTKYNVITQKRIFNDGLIVV